MTLYRGIHRGMQLMTGIHGANIGSRNPNRIMSRPTSRSRLALADGFSAGIWYIPEYSHSQTWPGKFHSSFMTPHWLPAMPWACAMVDHSVLSLKNIVAI